MEYKLIKPITKANGETVESVTIKDEFTGRDFKTIGDAGGQGSQSIKMTMVATGLTEAVVLNMDARDVSAISRLVRPFFDDGEA